MKEYLVVRLIEDESFILPAAKGYGDVEIRPADFDFPRETAKLLESKRTFEEKGKLELSQRIVTIVIAKDEIEADEIAEVKFEEVLDAMDANMHGMSRMPIKSTGFIKELPHGKIGARLPGYVEQNHTSYFRNNYLIEQLDYTQALLNCDDNELKLAIQRSYHWQKKSREESNLQLKCLFKWFAAETLAKINDENICPKLMRVFGFPIGNIGQFVTLDFINQLKSHENYEVVRRRAEGLLDEMREYRNEIVHSGFREWDISRSVLMQIEEYLSWIIPRLQKNAVNALLQNISSVTEFWEYFPLLFGEDDSALNDFHGNVLYHFSRTGAVSADRFPVSFNFS